MDAGPPALNILGHLLINTLYRASARTTDTMTTTRICFVRHGETDWNIALRMQGHRDLPLNAHGLAQAAALGPRFAGQKVAALYSSDLLRARQTAQPIAAALGRPVVPRAALRERHFGRCEGLTLAEISERYADDAQAITSHDPDYASPGGEGSDSPTGERTNPPTGESTNPPSGERTNPPSGERTNSPSGERTNPPSGESRRQHEKRVLDEVARLLAAHPGQTIVVVTHGGVLDVIYRRARGLLLSAPRDYPIPNGGINWLLIAGEQWLIECWGDTAHLDPATAPCCAESRSTDD